MKDLWNKLHLQIIYSAREFSPSRGWDIKNDFITNDKDKSWTKKEMLEEIKSSPERFSPNVLLRPLYQEFILPNLCYIMSII